MRFEPASHQSSFHDGAVRLVGELTRSPVPGPRPRPLVVFVEGSGPGGREQGQWPARLAACGIDSFAYDKPGSGASTGDWTEQTIESRADETVAAVEHASQLGYEHIVLLGGSQGGWVARLAATRTTIVCAVVTTSGPAVGVEAQERYRIRTQLPAEGFSPVDVETTIQVFDRRVTRLRKSDSADDILADEAEYQSEPWYRFLAGTTAPQVEFIGRILQYDPLPTLRAVGQPLLSVFGGQDLLVDVEESVGIIHRERERCERDLVVIFPDADHSIRTYTGTGSPKIRDGHYHSGAPAPGVVELIGTWINEHAR